MHRLKIFFRKQIITRCLLTKGWTLFALKRLAGAERALERGITLAPASYRMHLLMGRIHLARGNGGKALEELSICYHLDPVSFARQALEGDLTERVRFRARITPEPDLFELPLQEGGPLAGEWDDLLGCSVGDVDQEILLGTDFQSVEEYRRFQVLRPVTLEEIERTDMDLLLTQLSSTSTHGERLDQD